MQFNLEGANKMFRNIYLMFFASCLMAACGGASTVSSSSTSNEEAAEDEQYSGQNLEGGSVSELSFSANTSIVPLDASRDSAQYVLSLYSYESSGGTSAYQVGSSSDLTSLQNLMAPAALTSDKTEDFHEWLRNSEEDLNPEASLVTEGNSSRSLISKATSDPAIGSTQTFKVLSSFSGGSSYTTVTAVLKYKTSNFLAWVDQRNENSMTDAELSSLLSNFNNVVDDERDLYGTESDVDGDGRFNILFTQVVNQIGGSAGGIVTGFFYAVDLFSSSQYSQSNQTEIFYTFVPDPEGDYGVTISKSFALSNILPSVLPHEYQHMINFNMHYFENSGSPESSFLNEALSHLAEDIYTMDSTGYMTETGVENPARVSGYLASIEDLCITCGSSLYQRGGSYLLIRYLYEQAQKGNLTAASSGAALIGRLLDTDATGVTNIVTAAYGEGSGTEAQFRRLMGQFGLAVFLSGTSLSSDNRFAIDGIDLRSSQDDNRGTVLQGPAINSLSNMSLANTIGGSSLSYIEITADDVRESNGSLTLEVGDSGTTGAFLIQTGL